MEYQIRGKCFYCDQPSQYLIGVSKAHWKSKIEINGETCRDHVPQALIKTGNLTFGTFYWPAVANLQGKRLYHSYFADKEQLSYVAGWNEYLQSNKP
ncbi:hypothetical protein [Dyadobacter bucti]|uniref:hypothetical protein n=1 Tax=Dyadobacter bucti TaxID=2572203 RepID=UPI001109DC0A|nr:hypothetical protein [Dyadobacter bucti]